MVIASLYFQHRTGFSGENVTSMRQLMECLICQQMPFVVHGDWNMPQTQTLQHTDDKPYLHPKEIRGPAITQDNIHSFRHKVRITISSSPPPENAAGSRCFHLILLACEVVRIGLFGSQ